MSVVTQVQYVLPPFRITDDFFIQVYQDGILPSKIRIRLVIDSRVNTHFDFSPKEFEDLLIGSRTFYETQRLDLPRLENWEIRLVKLLNAKITLVLKNPERRDRGFQFSWIQHIESSNPVTLTLFARDVDPFLITANWALDMVNCLKEQQNEQSVPDEEMVNFSQFSALAPTVFSTGPKIFTSPLFLISSTCFLQVIQTGFTPFDCKICIKQRGHSGFEFSNVYEFEKFIYAMEAMISEKDQTYANFNKENKTCTSWAQLCLGQKQECFCLKQTLVPDKQLQIIYNPLNLSKEIFLIYYVLKMKALENENIWDTFRRYRLSTEAPFNPRTLQSLSKDAIVAKPCIIIESVLSSQAFELFLLPNVNDPGWATKTPVYLSFSMEMFEKLSKFEKNTLHLWLRALDSCSDPWQEFRDYTDIIIDNEIADHFLYRDFENECNNSPQNQDISFDQADEDLW